MTLCLYFEDIMHLFGNKYQFTETIYLFFIFRSSLACDFFKNRIKINLFLFRSLAPFFLAKIRRTNHQFVVALAYRKKALAKSVDADEMPHNVCLNEFL